MTVKNEHDTVSSEKVVLIYEGKPDRMQRNKAAFIKERVITITLIAVNIIIFIISAFTGDLLYNKGAFSAYFLLQGREIWRFITSMFLHADAEHLLGNMLLLYFAGEIVEEYAGKIRFLVLYFLSGICGSLLYMVYEIFMNEFCDSIGASGAVFGVVGALFIIVLYHKGRYGDITLKRIAFMMIYMVYAGLSTTHVNNAAHVGGLIGGMLLMWIYIIFQKIIYKMKRSVHEN